MDFVQVDASSAKDGTVYQDALTVLCGPAHDGCFNVAFFLPGDVIPPTEDRTVFMNNGGWIPYPTVAFWFSNEFNTWDCARAGAEAAPLNALCGKDVAKQYDAVLTLAGRVGFTKGCGLPPTDDQVIVYAFISKVGDRNRQTQLSDAYAKSLSSSSGGPDDLSRCKELGAKNEAEAVEARKTLSKP